MFFSQIGYYFFHIYQQHEIKEAVKHELLAKLPESALEIIDADIHKNDIEWEEEDKEFSLHGQMYDVACIKTVKGKKLIYCLNDRKEDDLLKRLTNAIDGGDERNGANKNVHHVIKFQASDFVVADAYAPAITKSVAVKYVDHPVALITNVTETFSPPPDLILKHKTSQL